MAIVNFKAKVNGTEIEGKLLSQADVEKIKTYHTQVDTNKHDISQLKTQLESINSFSRKIAKQDYYTDETHKDEMETNVIYMVAFKGDKFIAPAESGDKFWTNGEVPELFQLVRKDSTNAVQKLGVEKYTATFDDFLSKTKDNVFNGSMTRELANTDFNDGDSVAYMTKFKDLDVSGEYTIDKQVFSGHLALDKNGKKLYAHTGTVGKDKSRQASLGVYKKDDSVAGEVCLKTNEDGSQVDFTAPQTRENSADNAVVTKKFILDKLTNVGNTALKAKYQADKPTNVQEDNTIIFFNAENLL